MIPQFVLASFRKPCYTDLVIKSDKSIIIHTEEIP